MCSRLLSSSNTGSLYSIENSFYHTAEKIFPYFLRVEGNSMEDARIHDGDVLVVDRALEPEHGSIVIAAVDNEVSDTLDLR
ncbi:LexA family transcriptional regulator, partial [Klebsiella pneumoniae]|uniref:LexA family protein n=1 Tax=Klebsiella pneumoniae TaxID=573 RepID=UPI000E01083F